MEKVGIDLERWREKEGDCVDVEGFIAAPEIYIYIYMGNNFVAGQKKPKRG